MDKQTEIRLERMSLAEEEVHSLAKDGYISFSDYSTIKKGFEEKTSNLTSTVPSVMESFPKPREPVTPNMVKRQVQTVPPRTERSPEEQRERRLAYILSSGVALLLLGGVLLALTNWLLLGDGAKVLLISGIALLFAGMSFIAHKLKIPQTMLAFLMLFAFFVPIVFFAISYYGIFGPYLSVEGAGSSLFASFSALACAALYIGLFRLKAHRAFQYTTIIACAISILFAAAFLTTNAAMYVLILNVVVAFQLFIRKNNKSWSVFSEYNRFFPHFILCQLLLISFIQLVLMNWSSLSFVNIGIIGILLYGLARNHKPFAAFSILAGLFFIIGVTNAIASSSINNQFSPLIILILPTVLFIGYHFERKSKKEALLTIPLLVFFLLSLLFTHLFAQIMFTWSAADSWLYLFSLGWLSALFVVSAWRARHQTMLFFSILLSLYTIIFVIGQFSNTIVMSTILQTTVLLGFYVSTIQTKKVDDQLVLKPLKLGILLMLAFVGVLLWSAFEWSLLTGWLLTTSLFATTVPRYEPNDKRVAGIISTILIFLSGWSSFLALWTFPALYTSSTETVTHFLIAATILVVVAFGFRRMFDQLVGRIAFLLGGAWYALTVLLALYSYDYFSLEAPQWLTLYAVAGAIYFYLAIQYFFKQKKGWWGTAIFSSLAYLSLLLYTFSNIAVVFWLILLLAGGLFALAGRTFMKFDPYGGFCFYMIGHGMLFLFPILFLIYSNTDLVSVHALLIPLAFLIWETALQKKWNWRISQATLLSMLILVYNWTWFSETSLLLTSVDSLLLTGSALALLSWWKPFSFNKYGLFAAIAVLNAYLICLPLFEFNHYGLERVTIALLIAGGSIIALEKVWKRGNTNAIPILLVGNAILFSSLGTFVTASLLLLVAFTSLATGVYFKGWSLSNDKGMNNSQLAGIVLALTSVSSVFATSDQSLSINAELVLTSFFFAYLVLLFFKETNERVRYGKAAAVLLGFFYPYSLLLSVLYIPSEWLIHAHAVAFMLLASVLLRKVSQLALWRSYAETAVAIFGFGAMSFYTLAEQNVANSLVLSLLSVAAVLLGFFLKYAAYFLTGIIVMLANTLYTTRDAWGSLPWWVYLMTAGAALIGFATYQEWKKRDNAPPLREQWQLFSNKVKRYFSRWT